MPFFTGFMGLILPTMPTANPPWAPVPCSQSPLAPIHSQWSVVCLLWHPYKDDCMIVKHFWLWFGWWRCHFSRDLGLILPTANPPWAPVPCSQLELEPVILFIFSTFNLQPERDGLVKDQLECFCFYDLYTIDSWLSLFVLWSFTCCRYIMWLTVPLVNSSPKLLYVTTRIFTMISNSLIWSYW